MLILLKLFQKVAKKGKLPKSFYEATITLTRKLDKNATKKKKKKKKNQERERQLHTSITDDHKCKNPQENTNNLCPTIH